MGAEDTVIGGDDLLLIRKHIFADNPGTIVDIQTNTAKEQAKITWSIAYKAGYRQGAEDFVECAKYIQKGRREVVEWMQNNFHWWENQDGSKFIMPDMLLKWQAKLREWGL